MENIFREYDIRGIFKKELTESSVKKIGYYFGLKVLEKNKDAKFVSIGYDARTHSPKLNNWLTSGINESGLKVLSMGLVATPVNYFSNYYTKDNKVVSASIMITGSHNPPEYNGFKMTIDKTPFFGRDIEDLGKLVLGSDKNIKDNKKSIKINTRKDYVDYMIKAFEHLNLTDKEFVFDCGNGVAGVVLRDILDGLNIKHKIIFEKPDGTFPNHHPDPSDEKNLIDIKKELDTGKYALGFAYDGDADRIAVLSKKNNFKGDILAMFFASKIINPIVVGEVKCSQVMYDQINLMGTAIMYKTGHSNLKVKIKETNASLAAEVSGHIFFNDRYFGYDDAIYATLRALELIKDGFDYDHEYELLPKVFSTPEINISASDTKKFEIIKDVEKRLSRKLDEDFPEIIKIITVDGLRIVFEHGWGLIRASNTTPNLVTRFEADSEARAKFYQEAILKLI